MFGCNGKRNFPEIHFLLTEIYAFDPEMNLHSHFHFNSFSEIIFPQTRMFGCNGKRNFPEIHFLLTEIYAFDPEMNLHSHFTSIHFRVTHNTERARERTQRKPKTKTNTERARERTQREREKERTLRPSQRVRERAKAPIQLPRAPIQQTSERKNESSDPAIDIDLPHAGDTEFSQTITAPNAADPR